MVRCHHDTPADTTQCVETDCYLRCQYRVYERHLPADAAGLPQGVVSDADLPGDAVPGRNSWGRNDYGGPCPPSGTHRYFFKLYALDAALDLAAGATKEAVLSAMEGHVLDEAQLMGTYQK